MMVASTSTTRLCSTCGQAKPIAEFRRRSHDRDRRHNQCRECFALYMRLYRARRQVQAVDRFADQLQRMKDLRQVSVLCCGMLAKFGGLEGFCSKWKALIDAKAVTDPGHPFVLKSLQTIVRLIELADTNRPEPNLATLSDEELHQEIRSILESAQGV
jgi:hypothetical protein